MSTVARTIAVLLATAVIAACVGAEPSPGESATVETPPATGAPSPSALPVTAGCPSEEPITVGELAALGEGGGLRCFGRRSFDVVGWYGLSCGAGGANVVTEPDWLLGPFTAVWIYDRENPTYDAPGVIRFEVRFHPDAGIRPCGLPGSGWYRLTGHFDDPAAVTCRETVVNELVPSIDPAAVIRACRETFVATAIVPSAAP